MCCYQYSCYASPAIWRSNSLRLSPSCFTFKRMMSRPAGSRDTVAFATRDCHTPVEAFSPTCQFRHVGGMAQYQHCLHNIFTYFTLTLARWRAVCPLSLRERRGRNACELTTAHEGRTSPHKIRKLLRSAVLPACATCGQVLVMDPAQSSAGVRTMSKIFTMSTVSDRSAASYLLIKFAHTQAKHVNTQTRIHICLFSFPCADIHLYACVYLYDTYAHTHN